MRNRIVAVTVGCLLLLLTGCPAVHQNEPTSGITIALPGAGSSRSVQTADDITQYAVGLFSYAKLGRLADAVQAGDEAALTSYLAAEGLSELFSDDDNFNDKATVAFVVAAGIMTRSELETVFAAEEKQRGTDGASDDSDDEAEALFTDAWSRWVKRSAYTGAPGGTVTIPHVENGTYALVMFALESDLEPLAVGFESPVEVTNGKNARVAITLRWTDTTYASFDLAALGADSTSLATAVAGWTASGKDNVYIRFTGAFSAATDEASWDSTQQLAAARKLAAIRTALEESQSDDGARLHGYALDLTGTTGLIRLNGSVTDPASGEKLDLRFIDFANMNLVVLPADAISVNAAFKGCYSLKRILVADGNAILRSVDGVLYDGEKKRLIAYPALKDDESFEIPNDTTQIAISAFYHTRYLETITIPDSVTKIYADAFKHCDSIKNVTIGSGVQLLGCQFIDCSALESVTFTDASDWYYTQDENVWNQLSANSSAATVRAYASLLSDATVGTATADSFKEGGAFYGAYFFHGEKIATPIADARTARENNNDYTKDVDAAATAQFLSDVESAAVGTTVTLTGNVTVTSNLTVSKAITIDGAGSYGIILANGTHSFTGVTFTNGAGTDLGSVRIGMMEWHGKGTLTLTDCTFTDSSAGSGESSRGGALYLRSKAGAEASITSCSFTGNTATEGAAIYFKGAGSATLTNNCFTNNSGDNDVYYSDKDSGTLSGSGNTSDKSAPIGYYNDTTTVAGLFTIARGGY